MKKVTLFSTDELKTILGSFEIKTISIDGKRFCLGKGADQYFLFEPECPHMGYRLNNGVITPYNEITCPWHNYRFNLINGREDQLRCRKLKTYELLFEHGMLYAFL